VEKVKKMKKIIENWNQTKKSEKITQKINL